MREELKNQILNEIFFSGKDKSSSDTWKLEGKDENLDNIDGLSITNVVPENPRVLNHIESFDVEEEVIGTITYSYIRRKNERPKQNS